VAILNFSGNLLFLPPAAVIDKNEKPQNKRDSRESGTKKCVRQLLIVANRLLPPLL
jgi:hypothetical protein